MPSADVTLERSMFVGTIVNSILYGIHLTLYFLSCRLLLWGRSWMRNRKFYIIYSSLMLFFLSISMVTNYAFGDFMWIDDRNVPGGTPAYYANNVSAWYNALGVAADVIASAMADGLLLYRCFMFWSDYRWVVVLPTLLYVSSIAMSIMTTIESAIPGANIFDGMPTNFSIPWMALTVSFNIIVTLTIIGRLLVTYWAIRKSLGHNVPTTYIDVSAILVESALPLSALGLGYLITQALNSDVVAAFACVWGKFVVLAPQFIIYRVALGIAWSKDTVLPSIDFASDFENELNPEENVRHPSGMGGSLHADSSSTGLQSYKEGSL